MASWSCLQLGVCDAPCTNLHLSPYESKIGGYPDCFPSSSLLTPPLCSSCREPLLLLLQVYCPREGSPYHRLLHIFCCPRKRCNERNSGWLALRSQLLDPTYSGDSSSSCFSGTVQPTPEAPLLLAATTTTTTTLTTPSEWCSGADDWGDNEGAGETGNGEEREIAMLEVDERGGKQNVFDGQKEIFTAQDEENCSKHRIEEDKREERIKCCHDFICSTPQSTLTSPNCERPRFNDSKTHVQLSVKNVASPFLKSERTSDLSTVYKGPYSRAYHLSVIHEPSETSEEEDKVKQLLLKYTREKGTDWKDEREEKRRKGKPLPVSSGGSGGKSARSTEDYEKSLASHGDKVFQKFHKALSRCPHQVLRYHWDGVPLLMTEQEGIPLPRAVTCWSCGAPSVFELQLMPPLVYLLQKSGGQTCVCRMAHVHSIEFGTVFIYSCSKSCWNEGDGGFREESIFVQTDPDADAVDKLSLS